MAVPWGNLIPARSRVLPQGGAVLGQLTGTFQAGLEQGRMRAAEDQAPDLLLNYLDSQGQGYQPTLGNLATPAAGYVGGQQAPAPAQFDGRPTIANAQQQQAATGGGVDAGVQLLDQFEGFRATPYEDWSYRPGTGERYMSGMRIGYGQTIPGAQNITQEQAQAALRQQIEQQYIPSIVGTVGADVWGRLNPDQQGVLISLAHNYGSIPGRIVPALQSGDSAAAASAIAALGGDNSGINQRRREQEAMAFAGTGQPMAGGAPSGGMPATGGGYSSQPAWSPINSQEWRQLRALMINPATRQMGYQFAIQRMTPPEPAQPNWQLQEFNGTLYRIDANTGQAQPVIQGQPNPGDREMREDANGILRYVDTQEPVFPGVQPAPEPVEPPRTEQILMPDGQVHIMGFNPATGQFDIDMGLADPGGQWAVNVGPDGTVSMTQGRGAATRATEGEANANTFATRMERADPLINEFAAAGTDFAQHILSGAGIIGNFLVTPERQQFDQAARDFINANLRRESGATITPKEFANARQQYLPMPGDGPEVLAQKAANRATAMETIRQAAGPFATQGGAPAAPAAAPASSQQGATVTITGPADYDALAPGTPYTWLNPDTGQLEYFVKGANGG